MMRRLLTVLGDIWCAARRSCRVPPPSNDLTLRWMRQQEAAARESAERYRRARRQNAMERLAREARSGHQ